jgi:hypothetical protein
MDVSDFSISSGSVIVDSILKKLKNTDTTAPSYEAVLFIQSVVARCKNPGGQVRVLNNGKPFNVSTSLDNTQAITPDQITKNGSALSEIIFSNDEIVAAVEQSLGDLDTLCKQTGQTWTLDKVAVTKFQLIGTLFTCANGGDPTDPRDIFSPANTKCIYTGGSFPNQLAYQDTLGKQCSVPSKQDPYAHGFNYSCTTVCSGNPYDVTVNGCNQTDTGPVVPAQ